MKTLLFQKRIWTMMAAILFAYGLKAQCHEIDPDCIVNELSMNTGIDHSANSPYAVGSTPVLTQDPYWILTAAPNMPPVNMGPPFLPTPSGGWNSSGLSSWLIPFRENNGIPVNNGANDTPFTYERCFCLCDDDVLEYDLRVYADDWVSEVRLGGQVINGPLPAPPLFWQVGANVYFGGGANPNAGGTALNGIISLPAGRHCLEVDYRNVNAGSVSGFKVQGSLMGENLLSSECCGPGSTISGVKFNDLNMNGVRDAGEPVLPGWQINIAGPAGFNAPPQITDANGYYAFTNLSHGTYTVTEVNQAGWTQTFPAGNGSHVLPITSIVAVVADFGNTQAEEPDCCEYSQDNTTYIDNFNGFMTRFSQYTQQFSTTPNAVLPGQFAFMSSSAATTISNGNWNVLGNMCSATDRFMVVNGRTMQTGESMIYQSANITAVPDQEYSFCAQFKNLSQCAFDVIPNVRVDVYDIGTPAPLLQIPLTAITAGPGSCDYVQLSGSFTTPGPGQTALRIEIYLDETGIGDGNDLAIDDVIINEMSAVPSNLTTFSVTGPNWIAGTTDYNLMATAVEPLPDGCQDRWEVCELSDAHDKTSCIASTFATGSAGHGWGSTTDFPGYCCLPNISSTPGVFNEDAHYLIRRIVDCDCMEERSASVVFSGSIESMTEIYSTPDEEFPGEGFDGGQGLQEDTGQGSLLEPTRNSLQIVPNPFHTNATVMFEKPQIKAGMIRVLNLSGEEVYSLPYLEETLSVEMNLGDLPAGIYLVGTMIDGKYEFQKLIKQ